MIGEWLDKTIYYLISENTRFYSPSPYDLSCWWDVKHKHTNNQVLLIDRTNQPLAFYNLFLAYVLSTKPIPGICFVHNHYTMLANITYSWNFVNKLILGIPFVHSDYADHFIRFNITYSWQIGSAVAQW